MKRPSFVKIMIPFGSSPNVGILMPSGRTVSLEISVRAPTRSLAVCATAVLGEANPRHSTVIALRAGVVRRFIASSSDCQRDSCSEKVIRSWCSYLCLHAYTFRPEATAHPHGIGPPRGDGRRKFHVGHDLPRVQHLLGGCMAADG